MGATMWTKVITVKPPHYASSKGVFNAIFHLSFGLDLEFWLSLF